MSQRKIVVLEETGFCISLLDEGSSTCRHVDNADPVQYEAQIFAGLWEDKQVRSVVKEHTRET